MPEMLRRPSRVSWRVAISIAVCLGAKAWAQTDPAVTAGADAQPQAVEVPAPTRATIVSTGPRQWDVIIDDQYVCSTPCSGPMFPLQLMVLQSRERRPVIVEVGRLPPGDLIVSAKPHQSARYAGGIVATTLGGM